MTAEQSLDFERSLAALQAFVGMRVFVSIADASTNFVGLSLIGPLASGHDFDMGKLWPGLLDEFGGESIAFWVLDPEHASVFGVFTVWKGGFAWGRRTTGPFGLGIVLQVAGLQIRVMPAPSDDLPSAT